MSCCCLTMWMTQQARAFDEETLGRSRRVLGEDHPDTLRSANNFVVDLRALGEYRQARALNEDRLIAIAGCWVTTTRTRGLGVAPVSACARSGEGPWCLLLGTSRYPQPVPTPC
jgi:hypothetical protein